MHEMALRCRLPKKDPMWMVTNVMMLKYTEIKIIFYRHMVALGF